MDEQVIFQDYMRPNVCFGCGQDNSYGLQIRSHWEGEVAVCRWMPEEKYWGWINILNGGIIATLVDCHCMGTALAHAYKSEERTMDSEPVYRYATGTLSVKYLKPTPGDQKLVLRAKVEEVKGKKTVLSCEVWSGNQLTCTADVIALRVVDSREDNRNNPFVG